MIIPQLGSSGIGACEMGLGWYTIGGPFRKFRLRWKIRGSKAVQNISADSEKDWLRVLFSRLKWEYEQMSRMKYRQVKEAINRAIKESSHD